MVTKKIVPLRSVCLRAVQLTILMSSSVAAQHLLLEKLVHQASEAYQQLNSISLEVSYQNQYVDDFLKYRRDSGYPMDLYWPSSKGKAVYQNLIGNLFGCDRKVWWGDGTVHTDVRMAWDGIGFQSLNRKNPNGANLDVARKSQFWRMSDIHVASPLENGLQFLMAATSRSDNGNFPEDDHIWRVTLDRIRERERWLDLVRRLKGSVQVIDYKAQKCALFAVDGGVARGDRQSRIIYKIWLPVDAPTYPLRLETRTMDRNLLMGEMEVDEFHDGVGIGSGVKLRFPKKLHTLAYTLDPGYQNKPYRRMDFEFSEYTYNEKLKADDFKIDPALAKRVNFLDTGDFVIMDNLK